MKTKEITEKFIEDFWKWYKEYCEERYKKDGKDLSPDYHYHKKHMKFNNYAWDWVALYVHELKKQMGTLNNRKR